MKKKDKSLLIIILLICVTSLSANILLDVNFLERKTHYDFSSLQSPFKNNEISDQGFKLQAIFANQAKINNIWYKKGDFLKNYKILDIYKDYVLLEHYNGDQMYLKFKKESKINVNF